jgi:hypothetical protein
MIIKIMLASICMVAFGVIPCLAQQSGTPEATDWGKSVQGVQLSITMTNDVVDAGALLNVVAVIKNASTNAIQLHSTGPITDYDLLLTNSVGKSYHLTPAAYITHRNTIETIYPGMHKISIMPVKFGENIKLGDYTLKATRFFSVVIGGNVSPKTGFGEPGNFSNVGVSGGNYRVESNLLKVRIK